MIWVRQHRSGPVVEDPSARAAEALGALGLDAGVEAGQTVAVAVGSRGITDLAPVVAATVAHLRDLGLEPFIVPAMGSHGGATADGQREVLAGYGITEEAMGCPIRAQMDTVELCIVEPVTGQGRFPVHLDALAAAADHVVIVNRIKPHTMFEGPVESGLAKMLLIGLGKRAGAETYHSAIFDHGWSPIVDGVLPEVLSRVSVLAAVGIVENADDRTARIEAMPGSQIRDREPALLAEARSLMPRLPFDEFDIVLVDRIGKDISGSGWDVNTLGRKNSPHEPDPKQLPMVRSIIVRSLTEATHGNALGIGNAEFCRTRVVEAMDREVTWINAQTAGDPAAGMIPLHYATDRELLAGCTTRNGLRDLASARIAWIRDTLHLDVLAVSVAFRSDIEARDDLSIVRGPEPLPLDAEGNLPDLLPVDG